MCGWTLQGQWATVFVMSHEPLPFLFDFFGKATRSFVSNKNLTIRNFIKMAGLIYHDWMPTELPKTQKSYPYFLLHCIKTGGYFPNSPCAYVKICVSSNFYFLKNAVHAHTCQCIKGQRLEVLHTTIPSGVSLTGSLPSIASIHCLRSSSDRACRVQTTPGLDKQTKIYTSFI